MPYSTTPIGRLGAGIPGGKSPLYSPKHGNNRKASAADRLWRGARGGDAISKSIRIPSARSHRLHGRMITHSDSLPGLSEFALPHRRSFRSFRKLAANALYRDAPSFRL